MTIVPVDAEGARPELFDAWARVFATATAHALGDAHDAWTAEELRQLRRAPERKRLGWAALQDGLVVGAVELLLPQLDNLGLAILNLAVLPDHRRRGIGSALLETFETAAVAHGRSVFLAETAWLLGGQDDDGGFAAARGYAAAQTVLRSSLSLPADRGRLEAALAGDHADGYVLRTCWDGIPEDWLARRAELNRRMSTDVPLGDLRLEEESWDAERVRADYARIAATGRRSVETFAVEAATGALVGYTQVQVPRARPQVGYQQDTLVIREHRGHRLGLRLKAANALALMEQSPRTSVVRTWNADDNDPMLAVNSALGCVRDAYLREWQKVVTGDIDSAGVAGSHRPRALALPA